MENRKKDHIKLAFESVVNIENQDNRFYYEPLLASHPDEIMKPFTFLGKTMKNSLWISSMTGGTKQAGHINRNLAKACNEFGLGMGLGSCRILLEDKKYFDDFNLRPLIGDDLPFFANLGIAQIEKAIENNNVYAITEMVNSISADGLIIHVNPLQEFIQPEGDRINKPPLDTIRRFLDKFNSLVIVKEVGQGFGPGSIKALLQLPLAAIEFGALGGTNFSRLEILRSNSVNMELLNPFANVGNTAIDMVEYINKALLVNPNPECKEIIISGGIKNYLDGYYLVNKIKLQAVYGQASELLKFAVNDYKSLHDYIKGQLRGFRLAESYLRVK